MQQSESLTHPKFNVAKTTLLTLLVFLLSACTTSSLNIGQKQHYAINTKLPNQAVSTCNSDSVTFSDSVCGKFVREGQETRTSATTNKFVSEQKAKEIITESLSHLRSYGNGSTLSEFEHQTYYNVLRKHLANELQNTRLCRIEIARLALNNCLRNTCNAQCDANANSRTKLELQSLQATCITNKQNLCLVKCKLNAGQSTRTLCAPKCDLKMNTSWKSECEIETQRKSRKVTNNINQAFQTCYSKCQES